MLSCCHVLCEHVAYEFSLAACSCPVLHMAGDLFAGHVLVFLFCVSVTPPDTGPHQLTERVTRDSGAGGGRSNK